MKHFLLITALTIISVNSFAQTVTIIGTVRDFETNELLSDAVILEDKSINGDVIDSLGNFQLTLDRPNKDLRCSFVGYYQLIIRSIPNIDTLELPNLKMVTNYSSRIIVELGPDVEPDMRKFKTIKKAVESEYKLKVLGKTYAPKVLDRDIVFDLNEPLETEKKAHNIE